MGIQWYSCNAFGYGIYDIDEFNCFREREQDNDQSTNTSQSYIKQDAVTRPTPQYVNLTLVWVTGMVSMVI